MDLAQAPLVEIRAGAVRGRLTTAGDVAIFLGMPYAAAPQGELRWRAPEPPTGWSGVRDATRAGPSAPQNQSSIQAAWGATVLETSEDCLTVNVWAPSAPGTPRPVLVWIHGGGFTGGSSTTSWYDGRTFCRRGDVVVVSFNYRLGALGFLDLAGEGGEGEGGGRRSRAANCGMLDQIAALRWVRDNIASFGGDPGNVTVFGESAGAMSIGVLLAAPAAAGLFRRAILQSGAAHNWSASSRARRVSAEVMAHAGLAPGEVAQLERLDAGRIVEAQTAVEHLYQTSDLPFQPVVDGVDLPRPPLEALAAGPAGNVAVIVGTNADEMRLYSVWDPTLTTADDTNVTARLRAFGGDAMGEMVLAYRRLRPEASAAELWVALTTDWVFRLPAIRLLETVLRRTPDCWSYLFTMPSSAFGGVLGSCHGLDIPYAFDALDRPGVAMFTGSPPGAAELAVAMQKSWIAFARTGDPRHEGLPEWPRYDTERRATMELGPTRRVVADPGGRERALWEGIR